MKKLILCALLLSCTGCVTVKIPKYLKNEFPYTKKFYSDFDKVSKATLKALSDLGWRISEMSNPAVFEQDLASDSQRKQVVIFTEIRQTPLILSSRYMSLNIYLRAVDDGTDMEIRYISVTPILFKNVENYKNDAVVNKIFTHIANELKE